MKEEIEEKELKECTFAPKTLRQKEKRSLDDFLRDQQKHLERKQENINRLQKDNEAKEESLMVAQPLINEHSKILTEGKDREDGKKAYERLYEKSKKPLNEEKPKEEHPKKPIEKQKKGGERRDIALYEEAKKRQDKMKAKLDEEKKKKPPNKDYSRDQFVQQKYIKEYNNALIFIGVSPLEKLNYERMRKIYSNIIMIRKFIGKTCFYKANCYR